MPRATPLHLPTPRYLGTLKHLRKVVPTTLLLLLLLLFRTTTTTTTTLLTTGTLPRYLPKVRNDGHSRGPWLTCGVFASCRFKGRGASFLVRSLVIPYQGIVGTQHQPVDLLVSS